MATPLLAMRDITKEFPGVKALRSVSLEVAAGEVLALIGENGAGKSTLMKIIGGVHQPTSGHIEVDGKPVVINAVADATKLGIGFIHQELNVFDNLDVAANVFLGREPVTGGPLRLINNAKMHQDAKVYLERLGLNVAPDLPLNRLSIAQQQMVEIAKALSLNARLLIMDEPTSSLTLTETQRLLEVVHELKAQGVSVIYISHRLGEIEQIADRAVALRDGANAGQLQKEEITHDRMVKIMVGRDLERSNEYGVASPNPDYFQVRNLRTPRYPQREVSFDLGQGEILGFAGLVGAGRTEVAQALFGAVPGLTGTVKIDNAVLSVKSPRDAIGHGIYLVPEDRRNLGLIVDMPIRSNVTLPDMKRVAPSGLINNDAEQKLAIKSCKELSVKAASVEVNAATLSGGNQQKVVLAKWLSLGPKVMIFDEPTRGIDVGSKAEIYYLMRNLAKSGVAIIMISSDMEEVLGVSDRIAVMHEGAITGILNRAQCSEENIMQLAVGRALAA